MLLKELQIRGYDVQVSMTAGHATELAKHAARDGKCCVIAVGGDGTLCEIIRELPPDVCVAYFPAGSGNNFAFNLNLPQDAGPWLALLESGPTRLMRFGLCNDRPFASVASVGFDALLVQRTPGGLKRRLHQGAYVLGFIPNYLTYASPRFQVKVDGKPWNDDVLGVIVGRGSHYGGQHKILPECDPADERLVYLIMEGRTKWLIGKFAVGMVLDNLPKMHGVTCGLAKTVEVETEPSSFVQLDGDLYGTNPVTFSVEARTRCILAP